MRVGISGLAVGHPTGLGRLSRTYLLALAEAAGDWELHVYFRNRRQYEHLSDELAGGTGEVPANIQPHYPPVPGLNRLLLEEFDLPRQFGRLALDAYLGCDFTLPRRQLAARELVVLPDLLPFTQPATVGWRARLLYRAGIRRSIGRRAVLLCISPHTKDALDRLFPGHGCETPVIMPAISPRLLALAQSQPGVDLPLQVRGSLHAVTSPGRFLLSVGVLGPRKNTELLAHLFQRLVLEGEYHGSLVLAGGDGSFHTAPDERRLAFTTVQPLPAQERDRTPAIYDLGRVSDHDLSRLYRDADLLVSLSTEEGFGYPVIEALAHGTPALVTAGSSMAGIAPGGVAATELEPARCYERLVSALNALPLLRQEAAGILSEDYSSERLGRQLRAAVAGEPIPPR
ncbi:glycosyltransferase [bacterium]|nr:glycosyltransferase [bacterium]